GHHRAAHSGGEMTRTLAGIHLVGNAVLLGLGYYWLGIGESRAATLAWSVLVALALVCLAACLHGLTFVSLGGAGLAPALRPAARTLLPILVVSLAALALYLVVARLADASVQLGFQIASWLTAKIRKPVKPAAVMRAFNAGFWLVRWVVMPVL